MGCDGCCVFCLYCDTWSCRGLCIGSISVLSCRCCMFVSCGNSQFCMTCSLLMLVEDATIWKRHTPKPVSCLTHTVAVSYFIICNGLCACTKML